MPNERNQQQEAGKQLPVAHAQDVEFSYELADTDDMEALERAEAADKRQENG